MRIKEGVRMSTDEEVHSGYLSLPWYPKYPELGTDELGVDPDGGAFYATAGGDGVHNWSITSSVSWITFNGELTYYSQGVGSEDILISWDANVNGDPREGLIFCGTSETLFRQTGTTFITYEGDTYKPDGSILNGYGHTLHGYLKTKGDWSLAVDDEGISVATTDGSGSDDMVITIDGDPDPSKKKNIIITRTQNGVPIDSKNYGWYQHKNLIHDQSFGDISSGGGIVTIDVTCNCNVGIVSIRQGAFTGQLIPLPEAKIITGTGEGNCQLTFAVGPNPYTKTYHEGNQQGPRVRAIMVTLSYTDAVTGKTDFTSGYLEQPYPGYCNVILQTPNPLDSEHWLPADGGELTYNVCPENPNDRWYVTPGLYNTCDLSIDGPTIDEPCIGDGDFTVTISSNTGTTLLDCEIDVHELANDLITNTNLSQKDANFPELDITYSPDPLNISADGGEIYLTVTANGNWSFSIPDWVGSNGYGTGSGNGTAELTVMPNRSKNARCGYIKFWEHESSGINVGEWIAFVQAGRTTNQPWTQNEDTGMPSDL